VSCDLLIVGSRPVGSTFARIVASAGRMRTLMVDAGPVLTEPTGVNLTNERAGILMSEADDGTSVC